MDIQYRQRRLTKEERMELAIRVATDYNGRMPIKKIQERYKIKSRTTIYDLLKIAAHEN